MNKKWYTERGTSTTWNANEHEATWLCSPSQWTKYKNNSATYAIGGPSAEIYCDSYNSVNHTTGNYKITCQYQTSSVPGYGYLVNGAAQSSGYYTNDNTIDYTDYNSMYCGSNKAKGSYYWWIASPSANYYIRVCSVIGIYAFLTGGNAYVDNSGDNKTWGICPLVSLPSSTQLTIK